MAFPPLQIGFISPPKGECNWQVVKCPKIQDFFLQPLGLPFTLCQRLMHHDCEVFAIHAIEVIISCFQQLAQGKDHPNTLGCQARAHQLREAETTGACAPCGLFFIGPIAEAFVGQEDHVEGHVGPGRLIKDIQRQSAETFQFRSCDPKGRLGPGPALPSTRGIQVGTPDMIAFLQSNQRGSTH